MNHVKNLIWIHRARVWYKLTDPRNPTRHLPLRSIKLKFMGDDTLFGVADLIWTYLDFPEELKDL
jgi:hypothetical protein